MSNVSIFLSYAGNSLDIWRSIEGQRIKHAQYGNGKILKVQGDHVQDLIFVIQLDQFVESPVSGVTDKVKIGKVAFNGVIITELTLPDSVKEGLVRLERAKEEERKQREIIELQLREQEKRAREQKELEVKARQEFLERKKKYQVEWFEDNSPVSPLNEILIKLDEEAHLMPENEDWLVKGKFFTVLAIYYERIGRLASAGSNWRKARQPQRALQITENETANPYILTMRGGAFRDIEQLDAAEESGKKAIALAPEDYHPHNLLGAVYYQRGMPQQGDVYFQKAKDLGSPPDDIDKSIRSAVEKASKAEKRQVAEYLLAKDPIKYKWANYYLTEDAT